MSISKVLGWLLLIAGLAIIVWMLIYSYSIFMGKAQAPQIFKATQTNVIQQTGGSDIQAQIQQMINEQVKNAIPYEYIAKIFNLVAWSVLAFIFLVGGGQIARIGIQLIKK